MTVFNALLIILYVIWGLGISISFGFSIDGAHCFFEAIKVPINRFRTLQAKQHLFIAFVAMIVSVAASFGIQWIRDTTLPQFRLIAIGVIIVGMTIGRIPPVQEWKRKKQRV